MTSSSNGGDDDRRPDSAEWGAINQVSARPPTQPPGPRPSARTPIDPDVINAPPGDPGTIDMRPGSYRSYRGPLVVIAFCAVAIAAGYLTFKEDKVDLEKRPQIHFTGSTLQQAGQVPDNIKAPPPPPRRTVRIDSQPAGARVIINEHVVPGLTPLEASVASVSTANVRIVQTGYRRFETQLNPGQTQLQATLIATPKKTPKDVQPATLEVTSSPEGARVLVDGVEVGTTPLKPTMLTGAGPVSIRVLKDGYNPHTIITSLQAGKRRNIGTRLSPENAARTAIQIKLESNPNGATVERILANGKSKRIGKTGYSPLLLTGRVGEMISLRASAPGHLPTHRHFDVHPSDYTVQLYLAPPVQTYGKVSVQGPKGLMVFLGSEELDSLPLRARRIKSGKQRLVVVDAKTRQRESLNFTVTENTDVRLKIERADQKIVIKNLATP